MEVAITDSGTFELLYDKMDVIHIAAFAFSVAIFVMGPALLILNWVGTLRRNWCWFTSVFVGMRQLLPERIPKAYISCTYGTRIDESTRTINIDASVQ